MNIFEKLLEIKTWNKDLLIKATYIENARKYNKWAYYTYYYDMFNHTFYINDTDGYDGRASAKSKIEDIINKAYTQEMNSLAEVFKILQMNKKPKVFCLYHEKKNNEVVIDNVQLEAIKGHKWNTIQFKHPMWSKDLKSTLRVLWLK